MRNNQERMIRRSALCGAALVAINVDSSYYVAAMAQGGQGKGALEVGLTEVGGK